MNLRAAALIREVTEYLRVSGIESAASEATQIVESASGLDRRRLLISQSFVDEAVQSRSLEFAARRASGEPLQYVTGSVGFRHIELSVGPGVFIPRPETETVVEHAIKRLPHKGLVADIGTGSGAIALSLAHERPDARIYATELSLEAGSWFEKNRVHLGVNAELYRGDLFAPLPQTLRGRLHVVVSNPPYVTIEEWNFELDKVITEHEPRLALVGRDIDGGMHTIDRIAAESRAWLRPGGSVVMEIGDKQGRQTARLLTDLGYASVAIHKDLAGRPRVAEGLWGAASRGAQ